MAMTRPSIADALFPQPKAPTMTTREAWVRHMQGLRPVAPKGVQLSNAERGSGSPPGGFSDWRWSGRGRPATQAKGKA
jgi:hypothetical protein